MEAPRGRKLEVRDPMQVVRRRHPEGAVPLLVMRGDRMSFKPDWQLDALKVQLAFAAKLGIGEVEWTDADADSLEEYATALMRATTQPNGGEQRMSSDDAGEFVPFADVPTILNAIAVLAVRQVLAGAHRKERDDK